MQTLKFLHRFSLLALLTLPFFFTGCQKSADSAAASTAPATGPVKIGLAAVQTGADGSIGSTMLNGAQIAIDEWNDKGGVLGRHIDSISLDDEGKPDKAVNVAQNLVDSGVFAVIGHLNSACTIPASRIYNDAKIIQITPGSTNPAYTEQGFPYAFRICGRDDQQGTAAGNFFLNTLKLKKIAILHNKSTYGEGLAKEVKRTFEAGGGTVTVFQGIGQDDNDFRANISLIKGSGAEGFFWGGMYGQGGPLVLQLRQEGTTIPFVSGDGCYDQNFINTVGAQGNTGIYLSFGKDYHSLPAAQPFLAKYKQKYNQDVGAYSVYGYDAVNVLLTAVTKVGSFDPDKVAAVLKGQPFDTTLGTIAFDAKGDLQQSAYVIWTVQDGKFVVNPAPAQ